MSENLMCSGHKDNRNYRDKWDGVFSTKRKQIKLKDLSVVDKCVWCRFVSRPTDCADNWRCQYKNRNEVIPNASTIPDWCELQDKKEGSWVGA